MSLWFRFYTGVVNDPKAQMLSPEMFKHWVNVLCIAAQHDGELPAIAATAFTLRLSEPKAAAILAKLHAAELLDKTDKSFKPHNWDGRQYKHDVTDPTNADRQKRYRDRHRNGESNGESNAVTTVTAKRPETETETENRIQKEPEPNGSGADAPGDVRSELFDRGLKTLARLTGKGPDACRSFVGKCLKAASDDAVTVLGLIEDADRNRVVDPSAWISVRLKSTGPPGKPLTEFQRGKHELRGILDDLDRAGGQGGQANSRLLSRDSGERSQGIRGGAGGDVIDLPASGYRSGG